MTSTAPNRESRERDRIQHFRQRWAQENFQDQTPNRAVGHQASDEAIPANDFELSEVKQSPPVTRESSKKKAQKRSWRDHLLYRSSADRLAEVSAPQPVPERNYAEGTYRNDDAPSRFSSADGNGSDEESSHPYSQSPPKAKPTPSPSPRTSVWLTELYTLSWLTIFALFGVLARLGIEAITEYPSAIVTSRVLWANIGGSAVMGFLVEDRKLFAQPHNPPKTETPESDAKAAHLKFKKTIPLYIGLTTGFCGSFTSFSSFMRDAFLALTNALPAPSPTTPYHTTTPLHRNGGFSFEALLAILILHPACSLAALYTGAHLALLLSWTGILNRPIPTNFLSRILNPTILLLGPGLWLLGALFLTIFPPSTGPSPTNWRARATIPLLFSPPGAIARYYLAKFYNTPKHKSFPLGTFLANIGATVVLGMCWDLQHATGRHLGVQSRSACAVLEGVIEGFCGCLSTVSTWVVEISGLGRRDGWIYGGVSSAVGVGVLVVIMGGIGWTVGFGEPACG